MNAERSREVDFPPRAGGSRAIVGGSKVCKQLCCKDSNRDFTIGFVHFDRLYQRRMSKRGEPQKACTEGIASSAPQPGRITARKRKGARHRPFAGLCRFVKNERIRRVEPDGAQQLHPSALPRSRRSSSVVRVTRFGAPSGWE